jgi:hypothetical protein
MAFARLFVCLVFTFAFLLSLIFILPLLAQSLSTEINALALFSLVLALGSVLISFWVYEDGRKIGEIDSKIDDRTIQGIYNNLKNITLRLDKIEGITVSKSDSEEEAADTIRKKNSIIKLYQKNGVHFPEENLNDKINLKMKLQGITKQQAIDEIYEYEFSQS